MFNLYLTDLATSAYTNLIVFNNYMIYAIVQIPKLIYHFLN